MATQLSIADQLRIARRCVPCPYCKSGGYCTVVHSDQRVKGVGKPVPIARVDPCPLERTTH